MNQLTSTTGSLRFDIVVVDPYVNGVLSICFCTDTHEILRSKESSKSEIQVVYLAPDPQYRASLVKAETVVS